MRKRFDFILEETDTHRILFRFYPRRSSCHSFDDNPPKTWEDVYKVYYVYSIFDQYRLSKSLEWNTAHTFEVWDECSIIGEIGDICIKLANGITKEERISERSKEPYVYKFLNITHFAFGDGVDWIITKEPYRGFGPRTKKYRFVLWNNRIGFRFILPVEKLQPFGEFLLKCDEYMLKHGVGI